MVALNPPLSTTVVNVPDDVAERFEAAGWTRVKKATRKRASSDSDDKNDGK